MVEKMIQQEQKIVQGEGEVSKKTKILYFGRKVYITHIFLDENKVEIVDKGKFLA